SDPAHERDRRNVGEEESGHGSARTGGAHDREPEERTWECARGPMAPGDDLDRQGDDEPREQRKDRCSGEGIRSELKAEGRGRGPRDAWTIPDRTLDDDENRLQGTGWVHDKNPLQKVVCERICKGSGESNPSKSLPSSPNDLEVREEKRNCPRPNAFRCGRVYARTEVETEEGIEEEHGEVDPDERHQRNEPI